MKALLKSEDEMCETVELFGVEIRVVMESAMAIFLPYGSENVKFTGKLSFLQSSEDLCTEGP